MSELILDFPDSSYSAEEDVPSVVNLSHFDADSNTLFALATDHNQLQQVAELEQNVWFEKGYGSLEEYEEFIRKARTFAATKDGECIGLLRMFGGPEVEPPFTELPFFDQSQKTQILERSKSGLLEEVGTLAVASDYRGGGSVAVHLQRLAYRDAVNRGIEEWGIIMEPERVQKMNDMYGFTFSQIGPTIDYQGGMCAPHIMNLAEVDRAMSEKFPDVYAWFVAEQLTEASDGHIV